MPKRSSLESRFPTQSIDVVVAGRTFQFGLNHRTLSLGATGDIDYYWMDSSQFRKGPKAQKLQLRNLFSCIELWWQAAQAAGEAADPSQIRHLLVANCYSLFANDKAMQNVYRDAFLAPPRSPAQRQNDDVKFAKQPVNAPPLNRNSVAAALDGMLGGSLLTITPSEMQSVQEILDPLIKEGISEFQKRGNRSIRDFVGIVERWSQNVRKRGGKPKQRLALNQFEYTSKISFFLCYANAWIHILDRLAELGVNALSRKFMRFWHWQNQPIEHPDNRFEWDVFGGQVLALHPLSGFFMADPNVLAASGMFLETVSDEEIDERLHNTEVYWEFVHAILFASQRYQLALEEQQQNRAGVIRSGSSNDVDQLPNTTFDRPLTTLAEYLESRRIRCPECRGPLAFPSFRTSDTEVSTVTVQAQCVSCGHESAVPVTEAELRDFVAAPRD